MCSVSHLLNAMRPRGGVGYQQPGRQAFDLIGSEDDVANLESERTGGGCHRDRRYVRVRRPGASGATDRWTSCSKVIVSGPAASRITRPSAAASKQTCTPLRGESRSRRRRDCDSLSGPSANHRFCVPCVHLIAVLRPPGSTTADRVPASSSARVRTPRGVRARARGLHWRIG